MHSTLIELTQSVLCTAAFAIFLLPPGYLAARLLNFRQMRTRSAAEQLLWSLVLSIPLALVLAELLGRVLSGPIVLTLFIALAVIATALVISDARHSHNSAPTSHATRLAFAAAILLATYILLAVLDIQVGSRLFVPTVFTDWSVRIPMVASSIRGPVPPLNPLSAVGPTIPHLRYYYFWYVLCAQPARLLHLPATAAFAASSVWAGFALLATTFLALKYFVGIRDNLRNRCLYALLPLTVIGLDILQKLLALRIHSWHPHLDTEWWRSDRTPALLTTLLYAPHHIGGIVCCFVAFFVLVAASDEEDPLATFHLNTFAGRALLAGIAWAACVGTSTFIAFIFVLVCALWTIDLLRTRQFVRIGALATSGVVAYVLSRPFLHELRSSSSAAHGFVVFAWRSSSWAAMELQKAHVLTAHPFAASLARQPLILLLDFVELGFFTFVAAHRFRTELYPALRGRITLTQGQRALWAIFFGAAIVALFISSSITQSANDIGMHAGILVRLILVLWSVPYLVEIWTHRGTFAFQPATYKLAIAGATICLVLGLVGGIYGAAMNRLYIPLFDSGKMAPPVDTLFANNLSIRFLAIRTAWRELDRELPADARVLYNPTGILGPAFARYSNRQIVANDGGCGTAFGGDYDQCIPVRVSLRHMFGTEDQHLVIDDVAMPVYPLTTATQADFDTACRRLSLGAVLVESTDPVWNQPDSWVWTLHPAIAEPTVRAFLCNNPTP